MEQMVQTQLNKVEREPATGRKPDRASGTFARPAGAPGGDAADAAREA